MKYSDYEYGTTPRKREPYYKTTTNKPKKENLKIQEEINEKQRKEALKKEKMKNNLNVFYIVVIFFILLGISYRSSLITEKFNELQETKEELASIQKTNEQLEVSIESSMNLSTIEEEAENQLGMQKLDNGQKVYVTLDKKDYIEAATEDIDTSTEDTAWYKKIINKIFGN